jgi:hypothetical protein
MKKSLSSVIAAIVTLVFAGSVFANEPAKAAAPAAPAAPAAEKKAEPAAEKKAEPAKPAAPAAK